MVKGEWGSPSLVNLRKKRLYSPWAVAQNCTKKHWIEKCCLGWPSSTDSTSLRRQIVYRRDEECACCWSQAICQRLSKLHSDTATSVSPFKVVLPSVMDLVIKQLWPILITHLSTAAWQDGRLSSLSSFQSLQPEDDPVLPRILREWLSYRGSHPAGKPHSVPYGTRS